MAKQVTKAQTPVIKKEIKDVYTEVVKLNKTIKVIGIALLVYYVWVELYSWGLIPYVY
jgi:hypothetical protein